MDLIPVFLAEPDTALLRYSFPAFIFTPAGHTCRKNTQSEHLSCSVCGLCLVRFPKPPKPALLDVNIYLSLPGKCVKLQVHVADVGIPSF